MTNQELKHYLEGKLNLATDNLEQNTTGIIDADIFSPWGCKVDRSKDGRIFTIYRSNDLEIVGEIIVEVGKATVVSHLRAKDEIYECRTIFGVFKRFALLLIRDFSLAS